METLDWTFLLLGGICLFAAVIPMWGVSHGSVRMFDFPRLIFFSLSLSAVLLGIYLWPFQNLGWLGVVSFSGSLAAIAIQAMKIAPYTVLGTRQSKEVEGKVDRGKLVSILTCNVKQGSESYGKVRQLVDRKRPDIAIFMEINEKWKRELEPVLSQYEHVLEQAQENTYGMVLASNTPMIRGQTRFLLNEEVPSFHCEFELASGDRFTLIAIHPEPPVPHKDSVGRDAEISLVGKIVAKLDGPVLVTGDLNDVAWSRTTERFLRMTGMLDPRLGRGMFNSFHADYRLLRWPLDHLFHSPHFHISKLERQDHVGSDHFPMFYEFALVDADAPMPREGLTRDEKEEVDELVEEEQRRDERPVGTNWED